MTIDPSTLVLVLKFYQKYLGIIVRTMFLTALFIHVRYKANKDGRRKIENKLLASVKKVESTQ